MKKINRLPKTSFFSLGWEEKVETAEIVADIREDIAKFLKSPEALDLPLRDLIPFTRAIDFSTRGSWLESFIRSRFNMRKSPNAGDGIYNGEEIEIKTAVLNSEKKASFKQVRYNNDVKYYWFFIVSEDNTFKLYTLSRDQALNQSKEKGYPTTHNIATGEFNERDLYCLSFDPLTWNEIDCSCLNATKKQEYPDLFR